MRIIENLSKKHIAQLHDLYQQEWWTRGRTIEDTKACVSGSQLCIGIVSEDNDLMGFARVLTDYIFKALIFDLIVSAGSRAQGLGDKLLTLIMHHERLRSVKHFELYCLPEMFSYYEKHGFTDRVGEIRLMRLAVE